MWKNVPIIMLFALLVYFIIPESTMNRPPGILVYEAPLQKDLRHQKTFVQQEYFITPLAQFSLKARVLSKKWYRWKKDGKLVPLDLALGWGKMSDSSVLEKLKINQSGRKYYWSSKQIPIPENEISLCSANMHIIPANDFILSTLKKIRKGHIVRLSGFLVQIQDEKGRKWASSLTRQDVGKGACELVWVQNIHLE